MMNAERGTCGMARGFLLAREHGRHARRVHKRAADCGGFLCGGAHVRIMGHYAPYVREVMRLARICIFPLRPASVGPPRDGDAETGNERNYPRPRRSPIVRDRSNERSNACWINLSLSLTFYRAETYSSMKITRASI